MHHGTPNGGYVVFYENSLFTENKRYADRYQNQGASSVSYKKTVDNPMTYSVYLAIKNHLIQEITKIKKYFRKITKHTIHQN